LSYCRPIFLRLLNLCAGNIIALSPEEKSAESGLEHAPSLVLSAPDEESELRAVLRLLRGKKEKSFTGIVYRTIPEELALEAQRLLEEYGLKGEVIRGKPLVDSPAVRTLLLLLSCPIENYPRQLVLDVLSSPFFDLSALGTETTGFSLWESLTRRLAITGGDDWETRLTPLMDVRVSETEEEEDEGTRTMSEGARSLLNAVKSLKEVTSPVPKISSFSELASLLESFLSRFILIRGSDEGLGKEEKVLERVAEIIERLRKCDHVGIPFPETSRVPDLLETIFSDESLPTHRAGALRERKGIVIGDAPSLRGISFQETFFLSLSSDAWPSRPVKVPLLSEREKSVLREHLGKMGAGRAFLTKKEENEAEKFLFSFLVSENRIGGVSFLRSDREGKRKSPSPFLLEYLSLHFGLQVYTRGIGRESVGERFLFLPRFPREEELFPGRPYRDVQILLACLKRGASPVRLTLPGMVAETVERTRRTLLSWAEGRDLFPSPDEIGRNITEGREINYTFLDNASKCPYRTFLRYLADVTPLPEPEEVTSLSRRELGIIAHRALHILSRAEKEGRAMTPEESLRKALDDLKGEIPLGFPGLLEPALRELSDAIERTLAVLSEEGDWAPRAFEFSFGERWGRPVKIEVGGREIPLSGKVDRVDEKEGAVRIVDYKYSSTFMKKPEESAASASANQLPLYGYAVSTLLGSKEAQRIEAGYVYLKTRDNPLQTLDVTPGEALFEAWKKSLALLLESISSGAFPPLPDTLFRQDGRKARYCEWCDYRGLCRVYPRFPGGDEAKDSYSLVLEKLSEELPWHRIHRTRL
ncbi:MAG: PD-(D/E)XK nuclease family protein, partial [Deltaproteobacteria bacterium]